MNYAIRSTRTYPPLPALFSAPLPYNAGRKASGIIFRKATTMASKEPADSKRNTDKPQNPNDKTGDVMSHSFGEGYSTRSDEEGFGGTYGGGNQSNPKPEQDEPVHENHPAYDKSQGSEVKEKEKARHQTSANS